MIKSREYALERLDQWYADKFRRNYTNEVAAEFLNQITESIRDKMGESELESLLNEVSRHFSREEEIKNAQKYFSQMYASMEAMEEGLSVDGHTIDEIPEAHREEYLDPLFKEFEKMGEFVRLVREVSNQDLSREVSDEDINKAFIDIFGDHKGLSKFYQKYIEGAKYYLSLVLREGEIQKEAFDRTISSLEIAKEKAPYLNEIVFGDIK